MWDGTHIMTLNNGYHLWTHSENTTGREDLLCLHGGPGDTHEVYERFGLELESLGITVHTYDQLGSWYSDTPNWSDPQIRKQYLDMEYYISEVEEVRQKLGLEKFYLAGHSWGGLLSMEYALRYPEHLKGLIIISMIDNIADYVTHLKEILNDEFASYQVEYMSDTELRGEYQDSAYRKYIDHMYKEYVNRKQPSKMSHQIDIQSKPVYNTFQGDNEFIINGDLDGWDRSNDIHNIKVPTLLTFGAHETMPLATAQRMQKSIPNSRLVITPNGGHNHMVDNPEVFFTNLRRYFTDVFQGKFGE
ncbi:proline iminopeptidase-family hydrolase [Limosilactobacillus caviae]|uniref:Proline iminopeptidase n=1 Tax=Limosilactobacillus caviae TaxID=1769424 RepID=A0ABQ2C3Y3_9LACO|nr:proline iminopeptidase-family hydrolase [Limosilactobacillus caviae]MCD7124224.1 proline iminopeptidase-family hydrolase [Limosilactobacillus caviae]MRH45425.1 proline iminopeptidase-family hydrolase [Limosilactobacillus reuteri]GGI62453.1 proline iminopeptidase [Limosilactobacillus caviae]